MNKKNIIICPNCGNAFEKKHGLQKFCNPNCSKRFWDKNHKDYYGYDYIAQKKWRKKNLKRCSFNVNKYKLRKRNAEGSHTFGEWQNLKIQYNYTCPCCSKKEPEIKLTEDHIIPLSKGGSDNIENIQPLCKSCNSKKHTKIISYTIDKTLKIC